MNLIKHKGLDITKNYLYLKDPLESKYQLFKNGREQVRMGSLKIPKTFNDYSRKINVYENYEWNLNNCWFGISQN